MLFHTITPLAILPGRTNVKMGNNNQNKQKIEEGGKIGKGKTTNETTKEDERRGDDLKERNTQLWRD